MKKLTYIAQLSAVALLLVQMSSCDSMPDPSPISDKYARPEEVVETGIPVMTDGGAVIYSPTNDNFRYAASMIANSDGTMSAWYSTPGGLNGSMPARTKLNGSGDGGGAKGWHGEGGNGAIYYMFDQSFYGWAVHCPNWDNPNSAMRFSLYNWDTNYQTTLTGTPIATYEFVHYDQAGEAGWLELNADNGGYTEATGSLKFPMGAYLLYMERTEGTPGAWGGATANGMICWVNGSETSGITGHENSVQYTAPGDVGYSSQIRYYSAPTASINAVWSEDEVIAVAPTKDKADKYYAKDPSVVKVGDYYYMAYTGSATLDESLDNNVFVARSATINGKDWEKWNGSSWGGDPAPAVDAELSATETFFGAGEPSLVVKGDQIYLYYTYSDNEQKIYNVRLMTAAASDPNWPASMTDQGEVIDRTAFKGLNIDGCSVRYIEDQDCFQAVHGVNIADVNSYSVVWVSKDGVSGWEQKGVLSNNIRVRAKYARFICNEQSHITSTTPRLMIYQNGGQYSKTAWPTRMVPYSFVE